MKLMSNFLFLHPNHKRLVDFTSESVFISFIKFYRKNDLKKQLQEMNNVFFTFNFEENDLDSSETDVIKAILLFNKSIFLKKFLTFDFEVKNIKFS